MSKASWSLINLVPSATLIPDNHQAAGERCSDLAELGDAVEQALQLSWSAAWGRLGEGLGKLLDIPLDEVLLSAWQHYAELEQLAEKSRGAPGKVFEQEIAKQRIESVHRPEVEILVDGAPWQTLEFKVTLRLELQAFSVRIRDGLVMSVTPGLLKGSVSLSYKTQELGNASFGPERLPGTLAFDPGIPLGHDRQQAQPAAAETAVELRGAVGGEGQVEVKPRPGRLRGLGRFLFSSGLVLLLFWFGMPRLEQWLPDPMHAVQQFLSQLLR